MFNGGRRGNQRKNINQTKNGGHQVDLVGFLANVVFVLIVIKRVIFDTWIAARVINAVVGGMMARVGEAGFENFGARDHIWTSRLATDAGFVKSDVNGYVTQWGVW